MSKSTERARKVYFAGLYGLLLGSLIAVPAWCRAAEPQVVEQHTREFRVSIDGKPRGTQVMTFSRHSDKSEVVRGETNILLNFVVYRYQYTSAGSETWKDGRLVRLSNVANYNGEKFSLQGSANEQALHYVVNGESKKAPSDIWSASYWREPDTTRVGRSVKVLDSDKGRQLAVTVDRVGTEKINVESMSVVATRYRMRGDVEVDVWYDREGYVARQESMEQGHKTLLELTKIRR